MIYIYTIIAAFVMWQVFILAVNTIHISTTRELTSIEKWIINVMATVFNFYLIWFFKIYVG